MIDSTASAAAADEGGALHKQLIVFVFVCLNYRTGEQQAITFSSESIKR